MEYSKKTIRFKGQDYKMVLSRYGSPNYNIRIQLININDEKDNMFASTTIDGLNLGHNEVCIKNHHENEGLLKAMTDSELFTKTDSYIMCGAYKCMVVAFSPELERDLSSFIYGKKAKEPSTQDLIEGRRTLFKANRNNNE